MNIKTIMKPTPNTRINALVYKCINDKDVAISMNMDRQAMSRFPQDEDEQQQKKSRLGLRSIVDRVRGRKQ